MLGVEVSVSNPSNFSTFLCSFLPHIDYSIRVSQSHNFTHVKLLLYNSVAVILLFFKPPKSTAMNDCLCTYEFLRYIPCSVFPVAMIKV